MRPVHILLVAGALSAPGCFAYIPVAPDEVAPGQDVRLRLTVQEAARVQDLRLRDPRLLEGKLIDQREGEITVEAGIGAGDATRGSRILLQLVSVPRSGVLEVELRELDTFRTGLLVGGGGALITAAIIMNARGSGRRAAPGPETPESRRVPLLRFNLPLGGR